MPLGFGWLEPGDPPYDELPMRVNRIAYREFSRNPDLPFEDYKEILGREVFGASARPRRPSRTCWTLQAAFATERTWCQPSPLVSPERVRAMKDRGELTPKKRADYRAALERLRAIERRHREPTSDGEMELHRIARWVLDLSACTPRAKWPGPLAPCGGSMSPRIVASGLKDSSTPSPTRKTSWSASLPMTSVCQA